MADQALLDYCFGSLLATKEGVSDTDYIDRAYNDIKDQKLK